MNNRQADLDIPYDWNKIDLEALNGVLLVVGASDTGKTTFVRYLFQSLNSLGRRCALLDGDPGQSWLGPPTTLTLAYSVKLRENYQEANLVRHYFVGSTTPHGHCDRCQPSTGARHVANPA